MVVLFKPLRMALELNGLPDARNRDAGEWALVSAVQINGGCEVRELLAVIAHGRQRSLQVQGEETQARGGLGRVPAGGRLSRLENPAPSPISPRAGSAEHPLKQSLPSFGLCPKRKG